MKVIDNSNEVQINREKLFLFMRGEKSNIDTQNNLAKAITIYYILNLNYK